MAIERRLIRGIVEDLQELRSTEVEHELRIQGEVLFQPTEVSSEHFGSRDSHVPEGRRIVFPVLGKS